MLRWFATFVTAAALAGPVPAKDPPILRTVEITCEVVSIVDGDTLDAAVPVDWELPLVGGGTLAVKSIIVRIRLLGAHGRGCWADETRRQSSIANVSQREAAYRSGIASKKNLESLALGKSGLIRLPVESNRVIDYLSLERLLSEVVVNGQSLGQTQVRMKFASTTKGGRLGE